MPILGQVDTDATTLTDLYTVPQKKTATIRILVAERGGSAATIRIAVRPLGAPIANQHYITYERPIPANQDFHTVPIEVGETDVITVRASTGDLSFTVTGVEEPELE